MHVPSAQLSTANGRSQSIPHPPQVAMSVSDASQPSAALELQSAYPSSHVAIAHVPDAHVAVACASEQLVPHAPHVVNVRSDVSQPLSVSASQSAKPAMHSNPHTPSVQIRAAFGRSGHSKKHVPQWAGSLIVSTQLPAQSTGAAAPHALVQIRAPVSGCMPHRGDGSAQLTSQPPQLVGLARSVSQPSDGLPLQSARPSSHTKPHVPALQVGVALGGSGQTVSQVPQVVGSRRLVSQPFAGSPSQSA